MNKRVLYSIVTIFITCLQLSFVSADEPKEKDTEFGEILVLKYNADEQQEVWTAIKGAEIKEDIEKTCTELFTTLLTKDYNEQYSTLIPEKTKILQTAYQKGMLGLNFSKEILGCGGNTWEYNMVNQILYTGFSLPEVQMITIYIDGQNIPFTEGTEIIEYTRETWQKERMNLLCSELTKEDMMQSVR